MKAGKIRTGKMPSETVRARMHYRTLPLEWMDGKSWRLPSGQALAEFALQTGFLAPLLMRPDWMRQRLGKPVETKSPVGMGAKVALDICPSEE